MHHAEHAAFPAGQHEQRHQAEGNVLAGGEEVRGFAAAVERGKHGGDDAVGADEALRKPGRDVSAIQELARHAPANEVDIEARFVDGMLQQTAGRRCLAHDDEIPVRHWCGLSSRVRAPV